MMVTGLMKVKHSRAEKYMNKIMILALGLLLQSCNTYNSSFSCADARGLPCLSMSMVNQRIDSGEIEEVELNNCKGKNCKGRKRIAKESSNVTPKLKMKEMHEAHISPASDEEEVIVIGDSLYVR